MKNLIFGLGAAGCLTLGSNGQTINFVDADESNVQIGGAALNLGVNYTSPDRPNGDNLWGYDDDSNFANPTPTDGAIWAAGTNDTVAELSQTITGLTPGGIYMIYALGWTAGSTWDMSAGLTSGSLIEFRDGPAGEYFGLENRFTTHSPPEVINQANIFGETKFFSPTIEVGEGNRAVYIGRLGWAVAPGSGEITGYINTYAGGDRTWFDGLAYEELPPGGDVDGDGVSNGDEVNIHGSDLLVADTDGDGFDDGVEVNAGTLPNDDTSFPDAAESKTYVDADTSNTTLADGTPYVPEPEGVPAPDDLWELRDNGGAGFGNGSVYESCGDGGEDAPRLRTRITGLTAYTVYQVYGNFWAPNSQTWRFEGNLENPSGPLTRFIGNDGFGSGFTHAPPININADSLGSFTDPPLDGHADVNGFDDNFFFTNNSPNVLIEEGNRDMYLADLGLAFSGATGEVDVFIDDFAGASSSNRTWYDGVTYVERTLIAGDDEDGDGINNGDEISGSLNSSFGSTPTNPLVADSDGDLISDADEVNAAPPTDPNDPGSIPPGTDADGDNLTAGTEQGLPNPTDPTLADTDGDGFTDDEEVAFDPTGAVANDPNTVPDAAESKTYVDAQHTVPGTNGYTTLADGSPFTPEPESPAPLSDDNLWVERDNGGAGFGNGTVYESNGTGGEDAPRLATIITGLAPNTVYQVYGNFWSAGGSQSWRLRAGFYDIATDLQGFIGNHGTPSALTKASPINRNAGDLSAETAPTLDGYVDANGFDDNSYFTNTSPIVLIEEGDRDLYEADLGLHISNGSGEITVFVDDFANGGNLGRTWYDGLSYIQRPFPAPGDDEDGDGLTNDEEINTFGTDPFNANPDGDFWTDDLEVNAVYPGDPFDATSYPINVDGLFIDFSSDGQTANFAQQGPEHDLLYQPYLASHEVDSSNQTGTQIVVDRSETFAVPGFTGSPNVTLDVAFTDSTAFTGFPPTIKQMIGREEADVLAYEGNRLELMRDWLGVDPRTASGGNGDGSGFGPTYLQLTFSGLPAGTYQYRGYHHDTQNIGSNFEILMTDSTRSASSLGSFRMTSSLADNTSYQAANPGIGNEPDVLSSTIELLFESNGTDDVVLVYAVLEDPATFSRSFFGVNAIELTEAIDSDGDFIPDSDDPNPGSDDNLIDDDSDNLSNTREWNLGTDYDNPDSDNDGLNDDVETNTNLFVGSGDTGTSPFVADSDGDGASDGYEVANGFDPNAVNVFYTPPAGTQITAEDGVWTWFNDERAIWHLGKLYTGYVDSAGFPGVTQYDPNTMTLNRTVLGTAAAQQVDDHNNPSITVRPDGTLLAIYAKHGTEQFYYWRVSLVTEPEDISDWGPENVSPAQGSNVTYNNTFRLSDESDRIYNFSRITNFNPTVSYSDDDGLSWTGPIHFIDTGSGGVRPYPQTVSNGTDRIDMIYTDGHPDSVNCSIYHFYYQSGGVTPGDGSILLSDGTVLDAGSDPKTFADIEGGDPIDHDGDQGDTAGPERGTVVYQYNASAYGGGDDLDDYLPTGRAWTWDIDYDGGGNPLCVFQVQLSNVTGTAGYLDDRIYYYYARWTGTEWQKRLIAQGGRPIYSSQRWYGGGITIDPDDPNVVYISSSSADPTDLTFNGGATGAAGDPYLTNTTLNPDDRYEIWRGVTSDGGLTFTWEQITVDSEFDNLRPIVPAGHSYDRHALWFYGQYNTFQNYNTAVVGLFENVTAELKITDFGFVGGNPANDFYIDVEGGVTGRKVTSSDNLSDPFTDVPTTDDTANRFFISPANRNALKDFFRVEDE